MPIETDWTVALNDIPGNGLAYNREATPQECAELAAAIEILGCDSLACRLRLKPLRQGRYQVAGRITAKVIQACVVSLEPVHADLDETIDCEFWPAAQIGEKVVPIEGEEVFDPDAPDVAEAIQDNSIRVGQLIYETIAASLDPYPRLPGAKLDWKEKPEATAEVHPFAALAKLRKKD